MREIEGFSIKDVVWVKFNSRFVSFGKNEPKNDVHFTLSFNKESKDMNLHVTRNIDSINKPKIEIFRIDKVLLESLQQMLFSRLLAFFLEPLVLNEEEKESFRYISFEDVDSNNRMKEFVSNGFKDAFKIKKSMLKLHGDFETRIEELVTNDDFLNLILKGVTSLNEVDVKNLDCGCLFSSSMDAVYLVIRIGDKWFTLKEEYSIFDLLSEVLKNQDLARRLVWKFKRAVVSIKYATSFEEVKDINKPLRIVRLK